MCSANVEANVEQATYLAWCRLVRASFLVFKLVAHMGKAGLVLAPGDSGAARAVRARPVTGGIRAKVRLSGKPGSTKGRG